MSDWNLIELQKALKISVPLRDQIDDRFVYYEAMCHPSYCGLRKNEVFMKKSYESLEFIGDSILNAIVSIYLHKRYPLENEGFYTQMKVKLVQTQQLSQFFQYLKLEKFMLISNQHEKSQNIQIEEDMFESLIGALFLDQGFIFVQRWLEDLIEDVFYFDKHILVNDNYKDILLRLWKSKGLDYPRYHEYNDPKSKFNNIAVVLPLRDVKDRFTPSIITKLKTQTRDHMSIIKNIEPSELLYHYKTNNINDFILLGYSSHPNKREAKIMAARRTMINLKVHPNF